MKIYLIAAVSICILHLESFSQDIESLRKQYEEMVKNSKVPYGNNPSAGKYITARGIKFYTETYGQGQPLLFIHGNGGSINNFIYQIPYFSKYYKVIAVDSRGQGKTRDDSDSLSYEMMADDFSALLDAMKLDSVYVLGWSDGGINAILLALRHPEKVGKMAITGTNLWPDKTAIFSDVIDLITPSITDIINKKDKTPAEKTEAKLGKLLLNEPHIPEKSLNNIKAPTLVMAGDNDVIRPEHSLLIHQNIPNSYLWIAPNSGHSSALVYKDDFNKNVHHFFRNPFRKIESAARFF